METAQPRRNPEGRHKRIQPRTQPILGADLAAAGCVVLLRRPQATSVASACRRTARHPSASSERSADHGEPVEPPRLAIGRNLARRARAQFFPPALRVKIDSERDAVHKARQARMPAEYEAFIIHYFRQLACEKER